MNKNLDSEIKNILARAYDGDSAERRVMEKVFAALAEHQQNFQRELEIRIADESAGGEWDSKFNVAVKLVHRGDRGGFFPIPTGSSLIFDETSESPFEESSSADEIFQQAFFLNVKFAELSDFCGKVYSGIVVTADGAAKNFTYTLRRHEKFIAHEKILFDAAAMYKIRRPVIFSPYARKAVEIKITGASETDFVNCQRLDFQLDKNNLRDKLLTDCELCWNVEISEVNSNRGGEPEEYIGADGRMIRYGYFHEFNPDENIFVLPDQHCDDFSVTLNESAQIFKLVYNSVLQESGCKIIRLSECGEADDETFTNDFPKTNTIQRVRTAGDVEKILSCFNATRMGKIFPAKFEQKPPVKTVTLYDNAARYYVSPVDKLLGQMRNRQICYVNFEGGDTIFKADYANYVLNYLSQNYPEYRWAGVDA